MANDYFKRIDLLRLYKPLATNAQRFQAALLAAGREFWGTSGFRSLEEQARLYAQGRTLPGAIVTNAKPGQSWHNWGLAIDFTADRSPDLGLQPTWEAGMYDIMGQLAPKFGLEWGGSWTSFKDLPHIQLPVARFGITLADIQRVHAQGGYSTVWTYLDRYNW